MEIGRWLSHSACFVSVPSAMEGRYRASLTRLIPHTAHPTHSSHVNTRKRELTQNWLRHTPTPARLPVYLCTLGMQGHMHAHTNTYILRNFLQILSFVLSFGGCFLFFYLFCFCFSQMHRCHTGLVAQFGFPPYNCLLSCPVLSCPRACVFANPKDPHDSGLAWFQFVRQCPTM